MSEPSGRPVSAADGEPPRGGERKQLAPPPLEPLAAGERPLALLIAVAACALLAVSVLVGGLTIHDLARRGGSLPGAIFLALVLGGLALGMYRRRYMAVLGFEALLTFQIIVSSLALVIATSILAAAAYLLGIGLAGWLFWKLIRVMGRIQAGERQDRR
jgi:hypothetical protein